MALLRVSKQVNLDVERRFYSCNTFVMPVLEGMERLYKHYLHTPRRNALPWIRSVEVAFHTRDLSGTARLAVVEKLEVPCEVLRIKPVDNHTLMAIGYEVHDALIISLTDNAWERKATLLTKELRLHKLRIVLDGPRCILRCCLLKWDAMECLAGGFVHGLPRRQKSAPASPSVGN